MNYRDISEQKCTISLWFWHKLNWTVNQGVVGSNPTSGATLSCWFIIIFLISSGCTSVTLFLFWKNAWKKLGWHVSVAALVYRLNKRRLLSDWRFSSDEPGIIDKNRTQSDWLSKVDCREKVQKLSEAKSFHLQELLLKAVFQKKNSKTCCFWCFIP